eukprot:symbB.v1.2.005162.t1/scaffold298.1/size236510/6
MLQSVPFYRKYLGPFGSLFPSGNSDAEAVSGNPFASLKALSAHWSQLVWYRILFALASHYGYANSYVSYGFNKKLAKEMETKQKLERLCSGDNLRFGCSSRIYVYREPSTAIQINRGIKPVQVTIEQDVPEPELESPKNAPAGSPALPAPGKMMGGICDEATLGPIVTKLTEPLEEQPSPVQAQTQVVTARSPIAEETAATSVELLVENTKSEAAAEVKVPKEVPKKSKKSSSSSSSTSSDKKRKKKSSKSRKKSSSSSTSSKKRRDSSKKKKRKSSSTSASTEKKRKKRKSRSKRKSSSS